MAFLDELKEQVNAPIRKGIDPKLLAFANKYYEEEVIESVNIIKNTLRQAVEEYRKSNQYSVKRTFTGSTPLRYNLRKKLIPFNADFDLNLEGCNENELFFGIGKGDEYTPSSRFVILYGLHLVKITPKNSLLFRFASQYVSVTLSNMGNRYLDDIKKCCEKEGIIITRIYAKSDRNVEFPLGKDYETAGQAYEFNVWVDFKIEL